MATSLLPLLCDFLPCSATDSQRARWDSPDSSPARHQLRSVRDVYGCAWMVLRSSSFLEPMDTTVRIKRGATTTEDQHMTTGRTNKGRSDLWCQMPTPPPPRPQHVSLLLVAHIASPAELPVISFTLSERESYAPSGVKLPPSHDIVTQTSPLHV